MGTKVLLVKAEINHRFCFTAVYMILAGDIGGTHTRLALFEKGELRREHAYPSRSYSGLQEIVYEYLQQEGVKIDVASFGIAGPVRNGVCKATNLPWQVDAHQLGEALKIPSVHLLNDLEANAYGVLALKPKDLFPLQHGNPGQTGNRALIAAGTGLGEAGLYWNGKRYYPFASEGGHSDFAPRNQTEVDLFFYLQKRFGHVSFERVVSGPGLYALYQFLLDTGRETVSGRVAQEMSHTDPSTVVSKWGAKKLDPACARALDWFLSLYGSEAGNLALKLLPFGGLYIGGGIAPHLIESFQRGDFLHAFRDKGRFDGLLETIPIWIIMNDHAALLGAGVYAEHRNES